MSELPKPYVDCVILTVDGIKRIARLNHNRTHWQLASYGAVKYAYVMSLDKVVSYKEIPLDM